jgi:L-fuculose-phosphate aldolase
MEHQSLREEVARIARSVSVSGLVTGTSGNVSDRPPEGHVLVTPSGRDYALLEPVDVVLVDPEGRVLEGSLEPSSEMPMHAGIYRSKPRVGGIFTPTPVSRRL